MNIKSIVEKICPEHDGWFVFGSMVYGTSNEYSDYDIVIVTKSVSCEEFVSSTPNGFDIILFPYDKLDKALEGNDIRFIEALSYRYHSMLRNLHDSDSFENKIDKNALRRNISRVVDNSYSKSKKKLTKEKDYDRVASMKSLFHSIRILDYGIQVSKFGYIVNFYSSNEYYNEIFHLYENNDDIYILDQINGRFKELLKAMRSEFRKVCPKPQG